MSSKLLRFNKLTTELIELAKDICTTKSYPQEALKLILSFSNATTANLLINKDDGYLRISRSLNSSNIILTKHEKALFKSKKAPIVNESVVFFEKLLIENNVISCDALNLCSGFSFFDTDRQINIRFKHNNEELKHKLKVTTDASSLLVSKVNHGESTIGAISLEWTSPIKLINSELIGYQNVFNLLGFANSHEQTKFNLGERIKELSAIYKIANLGAEFDKTLDDVFSGAVKIIPPGFLFPEFACCKICYSNKEFESKNFKEPQKSMRENIYVNDQHMGHVEVGYQVDLPEKDDGPFLNQEKPMLKTIARELSLIAERKHFQEEKQSLQNQLLHADRLVTVGQLTAGIAHELNEPLGSILGFSQLIKKYSDIDESVEKDIDKIIKASLHAREIIKKLMLFSRQTPTLTDYFDINERIDDGLYLLESRLSKSSIELVKDYASNIPQIKIDPSKFNQVLVNLVVNAMQAMSSGGKLTIKTQAQIKHVLMHICDTGEGMTEEELDKIFIPFYTTKGVNEGTGLGLPVVLGIVQSHGGTIQVKSKVGKGSEFIVKFPIG